MLIQYTKIILLLPNFANYIQITLFQKFVI